MPSDRPELPVVTVASLVRAAQAGSREAYGELYLRFSRYVHGILLVRLGPQEAADLVQDVFLVALERLNRLREPAAFPGWIGTIARNRAMDAHRQTRHTEELVEQPGVDPAIEARADAARVMEAIRHLPDAYRETLTLRLVEGLSGPEIAAVTQLTPDSVRVNLHRGFKLLRDALGIAR